MLELSQAIKKRWAGHASVHLCPDGVPHAFVLGHGTLMADKVWSWMAPLLTTSADDNTSTPAGSASNDTTTSAATTTTSAATTTTSSGTTSLPR